MALLLVAVSTPPWPTSAASLLPVFVRHGCWIVVAGEYSRAQCALSVLRAGGTGGDDEDAGRPPLSLDLQSTFVVDGVEALPPVLLLLLPADAVADAVNSASGVVNTPSPALQAILPRKDVADRIRQTVVESRNGDGDSLLMLAVDIVHLAVVPTTQMEAR